MINHTLYNNARLLSIEWNKQSSSWKMNPTATPHATQNLSTYGAWPFQQFDLSVANDVI